MRLDRTFRVFAIALIVLFAIALLRKAKEAGPDELKDWVKKLLAKAGLALLIYGALRAMLPRLLLAAGLGAGAVGAVPALAVAGAIGVLLASGALKELAGVGGGSASGSGNGPSVPGGTGGGCPAGTVLGVNANTGRYTCIPVRG